MDAADLLQLLVDRIHGPWSTAFMTALAAKFIIKTGAGTLRSITGRIDGTAPTGTYYLQLWNLADVPADATTVTAGHGSLIAPIKIVHNNTVDSPFVFDFPEGVPFTAGAVLGLSTTEFTKTAGGAYLSATAGVS
jgi:hypothetical protein